MTILPALDGDRVTDGTHELRHWLEKSGRRQADLVRLLEQESIEVTQQSVLRWLAGRNNPDDSMLFVLHKLTGIKPLKFMTPAKRKLVRWIVRTGT